MRRFSAVLFIAMLFSAPAVWAQGRVVFKPTRKAPPKTISVRTRPPSFTSVNKTLPASARRQIIFPYIPVVPTEVISTRIALAERVHKQQEALQKSRAPQVLGKPVSAPSAKLIYKGIEIGELKRNERIIMGAAYDRNQQMVAPLHSSLPNGDPILLSQVELALLGYDIQTLIFVIRDDSGGKTAAHKSRIITYNVATSELSIISR